MLTSTNIYARLIQMGIAKTLGEIETALTAIDQVAEFNTQRQNVTIEIWDKVSPINGIPAETVLQRTDIPGGGEIYLVYVNGKLTYLQPHDPEQAGLVAMDSTTVQVVANNHADRIATGMADEKVFEQVLAQLLS